MTTILLRKHQECVIVGNDNEGYFLLANTKTGWLGSLLVDTEHRTYKITILFDKDTVSLGYFREAMKEHGWGEE